VSAFHGYNNVSIMGWFSLTGQAQSRNSAGEISMAMPRVLVLRAPGANCDAETQFAFERAGAVVERLHINRLRETPQLLQRFQILAIPGGFAYGDDVGAGKILANQLSVFLSDALREFRDAEKLIIGICNGFQAILKAGLIMPPDEDGPVATLAGNSSGRFEDRWIHLQATPGRCPFLAGYERFTLPVAHGEGRIVLRESWMLPGLQQAGQMVLRYVGPDDASAEYPQNPNGSQGDIAGLCDITGRVFGLMPHPERHILPTQHPRWTRQGLAEEGDGLRLFRNAVDFFVI
jgi:phosphoribosylformylglycinamidine synthase